MTVIAGGLRVPGTSVPRSASTTRLATSYHFYTYEIQIELWLATSTIYREVGLYDKAVSSVKEAQILVDTLSRISLRIQSAAGRIFRDAELFKESVASFSSRISQGPILGRRQGGWDLANGQIRRILADIAFEV